MIQPLYVEFRIQCTGTVHFISLVFLVLIQFVQGKSIIRKIIKSVIPFFYNFVYLVNLPGNNGALGKNLGA